MISYSNLNLLFPLICLYDAPFGISNAVFAIQIARTILANPLQESTIDLCQEAIKYSYNYYNYLYSYNYSFSYVSIPK